MKLPTTQVQPLVLGPWKNFVYLIGDTRTQTCAVVDPAWDAPAILRTASQRHWRITDILCTHSHTDHINRVDAIVEATDAKVHMLAAEVRFSGFRAGNLRVRRPGDTIEIGRTALTAIHTPGHTPGSACFWHPETQTLTTGDTVFVGGCGRCDLYGSDPVLMYQSLKMLREQLPLETCIFPGHDYGATKTSTLGHEAQTNRFMILRNLFDFVSLRMRGRVPNTPLSQAPEWRPI